MKLIKSQPDSRGELPLIPLHNLVIFPHNVVPFFVRNPASLAALHTATTAHKEIFLAFQKTASENPSPEEFHPIGTIAQVVQMLKLPDGNVRVLVEGKNRADLQKIQQKKNIAWAQYQVILPKEPHSLEILALTQKLKEEFKAYGQKRRKKLSKESIANVLNADTADKLVGHICMVLDMNPDRMIPFLSEKKNQRRLENLLEILQIEKELQTLNVTMSSRVKKRMENSQKEYFLNEQLKEIHKELGNDEGDPSGAQEIEKKLITLPLSNDIKEKTLAEVKRLSRLQPMSPESGVLRSYLEWIVDLPWGLRSQDCQNITLAANVLDADHFGLDKPKERILDFIAVRQLTNKTKGPILCFVGPPGTGKTSLGRSVARALDRQFIRISLGGIRDEAEIRGHRKTYVGALPGKIIQAVKKAGTMNPVFLLDEIDKIANDNRGDPASALLEVLDPEQNESFTDHYLEVPFDLSEVVFITTANSLESIPYALRDRMEVIPIPGYTMLEKKSIASQFIIPKQIKENGLAGSKLIFEEKSLDLLIRGYTLEAGVRSMERSINQVIRKIARKLLHDSQTRPGSWVINSAALHLYQEKTALRQLPHDSPLILDNFSLTITPAMISGYLGKERLEDDLGKQGRPGLAPALYYDGGGGGVLPVEVRIIEGEGKLLLTGQLGDVMKESAQIALSFLRSNRKKLGLDEKFNHKKDIHIHIPQGAIPVDGPSAGIALTAALFSAAQNIAIKPGIAMTGEVTLTDRVLPIGGVKEKALAAKRRGFHTILMPKANQRDVEELPTEIQKTMTFLFHATLITALKDLFPKDTFTPSS